MTKLTIEFDEQKVEMVGKEVAGRISLSTCSRLPSEVNWFAFSCYSGVGSDECCFFLPPHLGCLVAFVNSWLGWMG